MSFDSVFNGDPTTPGVSASGKASLGVNLATGQLYVKDDSVAGWQKNAGGIGEVASVNGKTGVVSLTSTDIPNESSVSGSTVTDALNTLVTVASTPQVIQNGLVAEYKFLDGSGTTLADSSGHGNNGTLGGSFLPNWIVNTGGLSFGGSGAPGFVTLPAGLNNAVTVIVVAQKPPRYTDAPFGPGNYLFDFQCMIAGNGSTANSNMLFISDSIMDGSAGAYVGGMTLPAGVQSATNRGVAGTIPVAGSFLMTWVMGSPDTIYLNNNQVLPSTGISSLGNQTTGQYQLGGRDPIVGSFNSWFNGELYYVAIYDRALSAQEVQTNYQIIIQQLAARGLALKLGLTTQQPSIIVDGDSIQSSANGWTAYANFNTDKGTVLPLYTNQPGQGVVGLVERSPFTIGSTVNSMGQNVLAVLIGANDFGAPPDNQLFISTLTAYCQYARSLGYKIIVATCLDATGDDTYKNEFNAFIRQNWSVFADALCDLAANPLLGADGAASNTTYFSSGLHPTDAGQQLIGPMWGTAYNRMFGNTNYTSANVYTSSATQIAKDVFVVLGPSAGSQTFTLLTSVGLTGQNSTIKNGDSHSWTIAAAGSETIDGSPTKTVAAGATLIIQGALVSPSTGGSNFISLSNS